MFMSFFISSYKGILCSMRRYRKHEDFINAFVAGSLSGLSILLDKNHTRRIMIALVTATKNSTYQPAHHISSVDGCGE
jgi:hypothetical protein